MALNLRSSSTQIDERMNAKNEQGAEAALTLASKIDPGAPEIVDLRKLVVAAAQVAQMDSARARAEVNEKKENWPEALQAYEEALAIDPSAAFASSGRARARAMVDLNRNIDSYLNKPNHLQTASPLAHAIALFAATSNTTARQVKAANKEKIKKR